MCKRCPFNFLDFSYLFGDFNLFHTSGSLFKDYDRPRYQYWTLTSHQFRTILIKFRRSSLFCKRAARVALKLDGSKYAQLGRGQSIPNDSGCDAFLNGMVDCTLDMQHNELNRIFIRSSTTDGELYATEKTLIKPMSSYQLPNIRPSTGEWLTTLPFNHKRLLTFV